MTGVTIHIAPRTVHGGPVVAVAACLTAGLIVWSISRMVSEIVGHVAGRRNRRVDANDHWNRELARIAASSAIRSASTAKGRE